MKFQKFLVVLFGILLVSNLNLFAQEEEMTIEEWQAEVNRLTEQKANLTADVNAFQSEVNNLKSVKAGLQTFDDCMNELNAMLSGTEADIARFRKAVDDLDGKIKARAGEKADLQAALDRLKQNKLSALPEFYDRVHNQMQRALDAWIEKPKEINYSVVKGDHLWGIAKKKEHYSNPFAWPVIYKSNRDQIKDPNLIYPKQVFKIPNLSDEEKEKYEKARRNYKPAPPSQGN
ncbi:MAG: LysM peptidoglycan-binding domain-containing protein [Bacteroidetes bacterium]|nr:LysM peptidoglycan-binding domain-containing protein [Bacteroidota bacterium]MBU1680968.1 LysM peptidoglycan-binding domain-containing protein [Bacteroidota bacterium]MBU2506114.1 LysM peptidoglycan-binding domain-containing protein [Bacteroidota bacterium]